MAGECNPTEEEIKTYREDIKLAVQCETISGLGVYKLMKQRDKYTHLDEYKKQKMYSFLMDAISVLAEDNRKSHQHTSMLLVSSVLVTQMTNLLVNQ